MCSYTQTRLGFSADRGQREGGWSLHGSLPHPDPCRGEKGVLQMVSRSSATSDSPTCSTPSSQGQLRSSQSITAVLEFMEAGERVRRDEKQGQ